MRLYPQQTAPGVAFNPQADGQSALSVSCENAGRGTVVVWDTQRLASFASDKLVTASVPADLYAQPGQHEIHLENAAGRSSKLTFVVQAAAP